MQNLLRLFIHFTKPFWLYHFIFTVLGLYIIVGGGLVALILAIPLKLAGYLGMFAYQTFFASQEFFYYRNAGVTIRSLFMLTFAIDMLLFITAVTFYLGLKN
ncbi:hypothetical protein [uncultured Mucilaginibacter sp.]|uniref:hypothetical protein n=1 Tax=uncultured Mucilaginibacter sp. TaxID=797541 RepID=UPI0025EFE201|nr:hypothetical protein [uncultured Mucilaginibacter sp.]